MGSLAHADRGRPGCARRPDDRRAQPGALPTSSPAWPARPPTARPRGRCRPAGSACTPPGSACRVTESSNTSDGKCVVAGFLPPVASATAQSIARRAWSFCVETVNSLNVGFFALFFFQKQPRHVAVGRGERRDRPAALLELGQRADERRPEVGDDDVDLRVLGDGRRQHLLGQCGIPVRRPRTAARR